MRVWKDPSGEEICPEKPQPALKAGIPLRDIEDAAQANTGLSSRLCRLFLIFLPFLPVGCPCYGKQDFLETIPISNWAVNILFILNWYLSINVIHVTEALLSQAIPEGTFSRARHFLNTGEEPSEP